MPVVEENCIFKKGIMNQTKKKILGWGSLLIVLLITSCADHYANLADVMKHQKLEVEPNPLELHGDSVSFTLITKVPRETIKKNSAYVFNVTYALGDVTRFNIGLKPPPTKKTGTIELQGNKKPEGIQMLKVAKRMNFVYQNKDEEGYLLMEGVLIRNKKKKFLGPVRIVSEGRNVVGVATTSLLVKKPIDNISNSDGKSIFAYTKYKRTIANPVTTAYTLNFNQGSSLFQPFAGDNKKNLDLLNKLFKKLARDIAHIGSLSMLKINGVSSHSPEEQITTNKQLLKQRTSTWSQQVKRVMQAHNCYKKSDTISFNFTHKTLNATWAEFKLLLKKSTLSNSEKLEVTTIIDSKYGFLEKEKKLQKLSCYKILRERIYPKMRYAKIYITLPGKTRYKAELENVLDKIIKGKAGAEKLTEAEYLYMTIGTPNYTNRAKWLEKASTKYNTWKINNSLGAAYLDIAWSTKDKVYIDKALLVLEKARSKKESTEVYYNIGMAYLMKGDNISADRNFRKANEIGVNNHPAMAGLLNGMRGYQAIRQATSRNDGKYKEAYEVLENARNTVPNCFNKGLAYLLEANNYEQAKISFLAAAKLNEKDAIIYYALAIVAARQGNKPELTKNLKKAVTLNSNLKIKALKDAEFYRYKTEPAFTNAIK